MLEFDAALVRLRGKIAWTVFYISKDIEAALTISVAVIGKFASLPYYMRHEEINRINTAKTVATREKWNEGSNSAYFGFRVFLIHTDICLESARRS